MSLSRKTAMNLQRYYSVHQPPSDPSPSARPKVTLANLRKMYMTNQKIAVMTAYDFPSATFSDRAGSDIVLVGDSLGMVCLGYESTNQVTLADMIHHSRAVHRAIKSSYIVSDLPFASYESSPQQAFQSAARLLRDGFAEAVKLEGGREMASTISHLVGVGIPVMGHVGLMPQRAKALGGFRVQGNTALKAEKLLEDALAVQQAGAFSIVLEAVPSEIAKIVTAELSIPTIGIGAGGHCSGQVLVQLDMLGAYSAFTPKFVKLFEQIGEKTTDAIRQYVQQVKSGEFPVEGEHTYPINAVELEKFKEVVEERKGREAADI